jgi:putative oxidoreductase
VFFVPAEACAVVFCPPAVAGWLKSQELERSIPLDSGESGIMGNNSQRDFYTCFLSDDAIAGPFLLFARLLSTVLFVFYIVTEIFGDPPIRAAMDRDHVPNGGIVYVVLAIQIAGVVLVALGYKTRFAALMLSAFTIATCVLFDHTLKIDLLKDFAIAGGFFSLFAVGPGPLSLDARRERVKRGGTKSNSDFGFFAPVLGDNAFMGPLILLGRIFAGSIFLQFGQNKVFHTAKMQAYMVQHNPTFGAMNQILTVLIYPAMWLQVIGGFLLVLGYKTRHTLLALAGFTIIAGNMFHHQFYIAAEKIQFFKDYTLTGILLFMFTYGAGSLSLDALLSRAKPSRQNVEVRSPNALT